MTALANLVRDLRQLGVSVSAMAICALASAIVTIWVLATPHRADVGAMSSVAAVIGAMLCGVAVYSTWRRDALIASLLSTFTVQIWGAISMGLLALLAVGAGFPLVDPTLAQIDAALGIDHHALLGWLAQYPTLSFILRLFYSSAAPMSLVVMLALAFCRRFDNLRDFGLLWQLTLFASVAISTVTPAIGVYAHLGIAADVVAALPAGSGLYHLDTFDAVRAGQFLDLDPTDIDGVVTFPSFHICMALTIAYALRHLPVVAPIAAIYSAIVAVATVPIGGHYVIDLIAGAAIFAGAVAMIRRHASTRQQAGPAKSGAAGEQPLVA